MKLFKLTKKLFSVSFLFILILCTLVGCSNQPNNDKITQSTKETQTEQVNKEQTKTNQETETNQQEQTPISVMALKGPTAMGMVKMMNDNPNYNFSIVGSVDEVPPALIQGTADIVAVPANLASILYNNTKGNVQVLAINTLGVLSIVENGTSIKSVSDLKGKTIYASGKGATPEYALNYILENNGINPEKDVTIEWKSEHTECLMALTNTKNAIAMLPQPFITIAQGKLDTLNIALDLTKEWENIQEKNQTSSALITGVIVAKKEFIKNNKEAVQDFLTQYNQSVGYVNENIEEGANLIEKYDIIESKIAQKAIPFCNITYIDGTKMKEKLSGYLTTLFEQNPKAVGGVIPNDDFYFEQ